MAPWFEEADPLHEADHVPAAPPVAPGPPFDPFAFSAIALMKRDGREALLAKLREIDDPADLKALADAQHLAIADDATTADALRLAIADSAARRLADRRAAAS
jgi:hypothetical protein